jgi:hypothetical protein
MRIVEEKLASRKRYTFDERLRLSAEKFKLMESRDERLRLSAEKFKLMESRQDTCTHLKGGNLLLPCTKDYNISIHTFINAQVRARCLSCGKIWWKHQVSTETWKEVMAMFDSSTNEATSSEVPPPAFRKKG